MNDIELYRNYKKMIEYYNYANDVMSFDVETICPKDDREYSYSVQDYFSEKVLDIVLSDEYYNLLERLQDNKELSEIEQKSIKKEYKDLKKERKIPTDVQKAGIKIISESNLAWTVGKENGNFDDFETKLEKLIDYNFQIIEYTKEKYEGFDVLLDSMEEGYTTKEYDSLFNLLEKEILPLAKKILKMPKKYNIEIINERFDIDTQRKLTKKVCQMMGYTDKNGYIGETLHPFTNGFNGNDVRTTTKYDEKLLFSNLYSVMHEVGHALYELQNSKELFGSYLAGGTSMGIHESQSRFYENYLGRSKEFIEFIIPTLRDYFPQLNKYTNDDIYYYCNDVSNQFYRTEADELTYPFHVLIRYKIEKMLFNKQIKVSEISDTFNNLFFEYFGCKPSNKSEGCYQDVHWSSGFAYFPTYVLGSAISAQILNSMKKDFNPFEDMKKGEFMRVNEWLKEHVHKYGASKTNKEVIKLATNEEFNPKYYVDYLKDKFTKIYNL